MVPPVALLALRVGFVALLWLFVVAVVLSLRADLAETGPRSARRSRPVKQQKLAKPGRRQLRLVITEGALAGTTLALGDAPVTIGRGDGCTLVLDDDFVSTHHARLVPRDGAWFVEDLGSTNGTYLDRTKVTDPTPVPAGRSVRIGRTVMEIRS
jgi:pSer/pThr/pTyr-binding forkhead associated (FHA) protein